MEYEFTWVSNVSEDTRLSAEESIRTTQESGHSPVQFCHSGPANVTLEPSGPLHVCLVGYMKCSCGKYLGKIRGKIDGSGITFEAVSD